MRTVAEEMFRLYHQYVLALFYCIHFSIEAHPKYTESNKNICVSRYGFCVDRHDDIDGGTAIVCAGAIHGDFCRYDDILPKVTFQIFRFCSHRVHCTLTKLDQIVGAISNPTSCMDIWKED